MKSKKLFEFAMLFMALLWLIPTAYSQARIGTVQGTVKDPTGALVSSAEVTISQPVTRYSQKVQTDAQGTFKLVNVPFNTYKVHAEAEGFQPVEQSIDLESTVPVVLDLSLSISAAEAAVTITEDNTALLGTPGSPAVRYAPGSG